MKSCLPELAVITVRKTAARCGPPLTFRNPRLVGSVVSQNLLHPDHDLFRGVDHGVVDLLYAFAVERCEIKVALLRLGNERGILHRRHICLAQRRELGLGEARR